MPSTTMSSGCCRTAGSVTSSWPTAPTRSSSPRRPPTGSGRWPAAWPATRSPRPAWRPRRRSSSPRQWTVRCTPIRRRRPTSPACAMGSATRSSSRRPDRWPRARWGSAGWPSRPGSSMPSSRRSVTGPSVPRTRAPGRRGSSPCRARPTWRAATWSSPPAARPSRSIRSGSSATARPARWGSRSPRRRSIAARPSP